MPHVGSRVLLLILDFNLNFDFAICLEAVCQIERTMAHNAMIILCRKESD